MNVSVCFRNAAAHPSHRLMPRKAALLLLLPLLLCLVSCNRDPASLVATGNKYFDRGKYKEASIMYRRALQKDRRFAEAWYRLGLVDSRLDDWQDALAAYQRAVQLNPKNSDAVTRLADLYLANYVLSQSHPKESLNETRDLVRTLLQRDPNSYDGLRLAGYVALVQNDIAEAQKNFEAANRVRPWQPAVVQTLCQVYAATGRGPDGEALAKGMIEHNKQDGAIYDFLLRYYLGQKRTGDAEALLQQKIANNPKVGAYVVQLARFYQFTGHPDSAEAAIKRMTGNLGAYQNAWMLAGDYYLMSNESDAALQAFTAGEKADAKNKVAYRKRQVEVLLLKRQYADASRLAEQVARENPDDPEAVALRATIGIQSGKRDQVQKAIDDLGPLIGKYPNVPATPMLRYHLARAYAIKADMDGGDADPTKRTKDLDLARIQLEQAFQGGRFTYTPARLLLAHVEMERREFTRVSEIADDILKAEPENLRARLLRTEALAALGQTDKAETELRQVLAINPNIGEAQLQLAQVLVAQRKYPEAEALLAKLQNDPRGFIDYIALKIVEGHQDEAIQILNQRLNAQPNNQTLRFALANVQARSGRHDDAIANFQKILRDNPNMQPGAKAQMYTRIGGVQYQKGDLNGALASFTTASTLAPNDSGPLTQIALIYDQSGRAEQARVAYENALKLDPDNAQAMNNLAYLKAQEQVDLDRALTLAERARKKLPGSLDVEDTLAFVYVRKNLTDEALRMMRDLVSKRPNNPLYHYHLALALFQKGDKPSAKKELSTALALKPSPADQMRIRELMGKIG
jgi:tetratricopeptide (TPR) repeat protein